MQENPVTHAEDRGELASLLHRWFVQYNPLYLLSAALVLAGLTLVAREVAAHDSAAGALGVAAAAEVYALALIGGAAFLTRIGLRRPAVMLGLLVILYQCDLTLHVETCAYLGAVGRVAAAAWVVLFVTKLYALTAALQLRASRPAIAVPALGALGFALLPQLFRIVDPPARTMLVALWVFGVGAAALWTHRTIESAAGFDVRGRRALRASWILLAVLALAHVAYWTDAFRVSAAPLVPVGALLATRWVRREASVWAIALGVLALVLLTVPSMLSCAAQMVAIVLALRAVRAPTLREPALAQSIHEPYRDVLTAPPVTPSLAFTLADPAAMQRLLLGAAWSLHLCVWTAGWTGGAWPGHRIALDVLLVLACVLAGWRSRRTIAAAPAVATYAHLAVSVGWISAPRGALQWGLASVALGFALLASALAASWRWREASARRGDAPRSSCDLA